MCLVKAANAVSKNITLLHRHGDRAVTTKQYVTIPRKDGKPRVVGVSFKPRTV
jgi:hypothetical protein